jgi:hypothetical protein
MIIYQKTQEKTGLLKKSCHNIKFRIPHSQEPKE